MAPVFVQAHTGQVAEGGGTVVTCANFDVGAGANRSLVAIVVSQRGTSAPTCTVVFNGSENFTLRHSHTYVHWGSTRSSVFLFTLDNPTNTTADVVATLNASCTDATMVVLEFTGANNGVGANVGSVDGDSSTTTVTIPITTTSSNALIIGGVNIANPEGDYMTPTSCNERADFSGLNAIAQWVADKAATAGADTIGGTLAANVFFTGGAIELLGAATAASLVPPNAASRMNHLLRR